MNHVLESATLQIKVNTAQARWSLISRQPHGPSIESAGVSVVYRRGRTRQQALNQWSPVSVSDIVTRPSPHGPLRQLDLQIGPDRNGLLYTLSFALPVNHAMLLCKLAVENEGARPVRLERIELLSAGFIYRSRPGPRGRISFSPRSEKASPRLAARDRRASMSRPPPLTLPGDYAFYSNGWQSWSNAQVYAAKDRFKRTRLGPLRAPIVANPDTPRPAGEGTYASDMFGVLGDREQRNGILLGFLSQKQHFGSLEAWIGSGAPAARLWANGDQARLNPGSEIETDWACIAFLHLDTHDPLAPYLDAVSREHDLIRREETLAEAPIGWCSWYHFFRQVSAEDIRANTTAATQLRPDLTLDLIQIDDGFESQVGDWFRFNQRFPQGVAPLAAEIGQAGFSAGLWLAPFLVHPKSDLACNHPDWLLRGRFNRPVNAGHVWNGFHTALDLTHPDAVSYVQDLTSTAVEEWGFPYLKLDFLYAAALPGRHRDPTQTRAQVLRTGLQAIRAAAGEKTFLLGCGCPLGPAIGLVDAMRIGADVAPHWDPKYRGIMRFFKNEPDLPSARNAIHNALTRSALHRRWWINDPDCLILSSGDNQEKAEKLNPAEIQTLATVIALSGGSMMLSDHLPDLPRHRLRIAELLTPLIGKRPHVLDWFDNPTPTRLQLDLEAALGKWHLLALFNWEDSPQDITLHLEDFYLDPGMDYYGREFWSGDVYRVPAGRAARSQIVLENVPAHGTALLAVRPHRPFHPEYLGSDLHISQGLEVVSWDWKRRSAQHGELNFRLERPGQAHGEIELYLPASPQKAYLNEKPIPWHHSGDGRYRIAVDFDRIANLQIIL